jgi:hypothetical protein
MTFPSALWPPSRRMAWRWNRIGHRLERLEAGRDDSYIATVVIVVAVVLVVLVTRDLPFMPGGEGCCLRANLPIHHL